MKIKSINLSRLHITYHHEFHTEFKYLMESYLNPMGALEKPNSDTYYDFMRNWVDPYTRQARDPSYVPSEEAIKEYEEWLDASSKTDESFYEMAEAISETGFEPLIMDINALIDRFSPLTE